MTAGAWLKTAQTELTNANISSARLDSLIMIEEVTGRDRTWLLAHLDSELSPTQLRKLGRWLKRRTQHEPIAYIRGFSEFYGRKFRVTKRVLEPRPESETMIDMLKRLNLPTKPVIADVGTGTGCLGISAALEINGAQVDLYDIDSSCLAVARHNCQLHEVRLNLRKRDLLNRPLRSYDVILANLPYVPNGWQLNPAADHEPKLAIFGGKDGLDVYRRLFSQIERHSWTGLTVLTEALPPQHGELKQVAGKFGFKLISAEDFIQVFEN